MGTAGERGGFRHYRREDSEDRKGRMVKVGKAVWNCLLGNRSFFKKEKLGLCLEEKEVGHEAGQGLKSGERKAAGISWGVLIRRNVRKSDTENRSIHFFKEGGRQEKRPATELTKILTKK